MQKTEIHLPEEIFSQFLESINGIKFSQREVDVMACLNKGRGTKKIGLILAIAPKTVYAHLRNVMVKLECSSREGIIDFIEKSNKRDIFQAYYESLLIKKNFEQLMKKLSKDNGANRLTCDLIYNKLRKISLVLIHQIETHLKLVGIKVNLIDKENKFTSSLEIPDFVISSFEEVYDSQDKGTHSKIFLDLRNGIESQDIERISLEDEDNYYLFFFKLLSRLLPNQDLKDINQEFTNSCSNVSFLDESLRDSEGKSAVESFPNNRFWKRLNKKGAGVSLLILVIFVGIFLVSKAYFFGEGSNYKLEAIRSDLMIPNKSTLLTRSDILTTMAELLRKHEGIKSLALTGIGGIGKTTIARQYAQLENPSVLWEINAETSERALESFEDLSHALAKSEYERNTLREILEIKDVHKKERQVLNFVKGKLKENKGWLLIFDNVENFSEIQNLIPYDPHNWGDGTIILTTRNSNIHNNPSINETLRISELQPAERLELFKRIMSNGNNKSFSNLQNTETQKFLEKIPPFPLDISLAANYIKSTQMSYDDYINNLSTSRSNFLDLQENVLRNSTDYPKTRYEILSVSLKKFIETHPDFADLMLFVCLLDSHNIPLDLLKTNKDGLIVDKFIHNLNKYSLITNVVNHPLLGTAINLHKSTQNLSLDYLANSFQSEKKSEAIIKIVDSFENHIAELMDNEKFLKMHHLDNHLKAILQHDTLLISPSKGALESELGSIYYFMDRYDDALEHLNKSLEYLKVDSKHNDIRKAITLSQMGKVYRDKGEYKKAEDFFRKSLTIYENSPNTNKLEYSRTLAYLGSTCSELESFDEGKQYLNTALKINQENKGSQLSKAWIFLHLAFIERQQGNYDQAKKMYEDSLKIYRSSENEIRTFRVMGSLSWVYSKLGNYQKAKDIIEEGLEKYTTRISNKDINAAGLMIHLGNVYNKLGRNEEANSILEKSLFLHEKLLGGSNIRALGVRGHLGNVLSDLGNTKRAIELIEPALIAYEKEYGHDHLNTAELLNYLGKAYLLQHNFDKAELAFHKVLIIYVKKDHPDAFAILESLTDLYKAKAEKAYSDGNHTQSQIYHLKATENISKSLNILLTKFPKDSPHISRIQKKLDKLLLLKQNTFSFK